MLVLSLFMANTIIIQVNFDCDATATQHLQHQYVYTVDPIHGRPLFCEILYIWRIVCGPQIYHEHKINVFFLT